MQRIRSKFISLALIVSFLPQTVQALEITFTTPSKDKITLSIQEQGIVQTVDEETGQLMGHAKPFKLTTLIHKDRSKTIVPRSNIVVFSARTASAKSKEYFLYLPTVDKSVEKGEIKVMKRSNSITFQSTLPIEENKKMKAVLK